MTTLDVGNGNIAAGLNLSDRWPDGIYLTAQVGGKTHRSLDADLRPGWKHYNTTGGRGYIFYVKKLVMSNELEVDSLVTPEEVKIVERIARATGNVSIADIFSKLVSAS